MFKKNRWRTFLKVWCVFLAIGVTLQGSAMWWVVYHGWGLLDRYPGVRVLIFLPILILAASIATYFARKYWWTIVVALSAFVLTNMYVEASQSLAGSTSEAFIRMLLSNSVSIASIAATWILGVKARPDFEAGTSQSISETF